jgi:hypothetical protein
MEDVVIKVLGVGYKPPPTRFYKAATFDLKKSLNFLLVSILSMIEKKHIIESTIFALC